MKDCSPRRQTSAPSVSSSHLCELINIGWHHLPPPSWWGWQAPVRPNPIMPRGREYLELSHTYIPYQQWGARIPGAIKNRAWNLRPMWGTEHALVDPVRYQFMSAAWRSSHPLPNGLQRLWGRMPVSHRIGVGVVGGSGVGYGLYESCGEE
jgi:hypothetical protein